MQQNRELGLYYVDPYTAAAVFKGVLSIEAADKQRAETLMR